MDCHNIERYITLFIDDKLTGTLLRKFINHIESCNNCFDEMETNYLLKEALLRLEDDGTYDLHGELTRKIAAMKKCVEVHEIVTLIRRMALLAAGLALGLELVFLYAFYL